MGMVKKMEDVEHLHIHVLIFYRGGIVGEGEEHKGS